jgi:hypothetical protein
MKKEFILNLKNKDKKYNLKLFLKEYVIKDYVSLL